MSLDDRTAWGEAHQDLPQKYPDTTRSPLRTSRYSELMVRQINKSGAYAHADEGSYFIAQNATALTGIAGHAAPVLANFYTKAFYHLYNGDTTKRVYMDFITLELTVAGAGSTDCSWAAECDTGATRVSSGGSALTAVCPNMNSSAAISTSSVITAGAVVLNAATTSQRKLGAGRIRTVVGVVGDNYTFDFGSDKKDMTSNVLEGTLQANIRIALPPVILGPTDQFALHLAGVSQSGANTYLVRSGFWIR